MARDKTFRHVVAAQEIATSAKVNHAVKARVGKLNAHEEYYYRFSTGTAHSPVGQFRTALPADSNEPVRFAFLSCQDYTHGYYNAHELMVKGDYDFVVCLGDYIYAEAYHSKKGGTGVRDDKIGKAELPEPRHRPRGGHLPGLPRQVLALSLRPGAARGASEVPDGDALGRPRGPGQLRRAARRTAVCRRRKHFSAKRKAAAYKAFFNSMPAFTTGERQYRTLNFGRTVDLIIMDQRRYRANQPCDDAVAPPCADWNSPRDLLGKAQMAFVQKQLQSSKAAWKVLANEVTIMPTRVLGGANFTYDTWTGYPQEREQLLSFIRDKGIKDVVFITGDIHTFITGDVRTNNGDGETVAIEFVGGSITSQGLGETDLPAGDGLTIKGNDANPHTDPAIIDALRGINTWVKDADFDHHGFATVKASQDSFDLDLVRLETIKKRSKAVLPKTPAFNMSVKRGQKSILS